MELLGGSFELLTFGFTAASLICFFVSANFFILNQVKTAN
jgi:hypothetical protein